MPASDRSPSRSRTSGIRRWFVACVGVAACGGDAVARDLPSIDGRSIDPKVVAHVAARDGIDEAAARERVVETLRLVAAARAETGTAELAPARREHIERTARADAYCTTIRGDHRNRHRGGDPMPHARRRSALRASGDTRRCQRSRPPAG